MILISINLPILPSSSESAPLSNPPPNGDWIVSDNEPLRDAEESLGVSRIQTHEDGLQQLPAKSDRVSFAGINDIVQLCKDLMHGLKINNLLLQPW